MTAGTTPEERLIQYKSYLIGINTGLTYKARSWLDTADFEEKFGYPYPTRNEQAFNKELSFEYYVKGFNQGFYGTGGLDT